ncbi:unnamed protein product [Gongylonema pulchrum]|uniref:non-specific serine/threonine protein kinase n=1 Tax=Gongylonema pulchrum TaxID=637853 RepID=A0A183DD74_9BILA|nr:unnamed protein product [Gongylonema pulchrum]
MESGKQGRFDDREVAVKRVIADIRLADREVDLLRESDAHPNVIRYFCMESDSNFRYIALELCDYSLSDYVENEKVREYCPLSEMDILLQATKGLAYLHGINIGELIILVTPPFLYITNCSPSNDKHAGRAVSGRESKFHWVG